VLVLGVVYGYFFSSALSGGALVYPVVTGTLLVAAMLVATAFTRDKHIIALIFFASFLGLAVMSATTVSLSYLIASLVSFAILLLAGFRAMSASGSSPNIEIGRFARVFVPLGISALAILAAFIYTSSFVGKDFSVPKESFRGLVAPLEAARSFLPGFSLDMTVPALIRVVLDANPPEELRGIPRDVKEQFLRESEAQLLKTISDALGVPVSRGDSVLDALHRAASAQIVKIPEDLKTPALFAFGFLVFLTIKSFGFIFYYPILLMAWLIYKLLITTGFAKVVEEDIKREVLSL